MRIRRRPPLPLSTPQRPNPSTQNPPKNHTATAERGLHSDGDLISAGLQHGWILSPHPTPSDPHPKQVLNQEKDYSSSSSSSTHKTLDAQVINNERSGEEMERTNAEAKSNALSYISHGTCTSIGGDNNSHNNNTDGGVVSLKEDRGNNVVGKKVRRSPAVLMEGSRCSRVNGRGWRCSQQTLIGYSLCEHHLGKGRIRSISSGSSGGVRVGNQEMINSSNNNVGARKPKTKKEREKARSMSSLLDKGDDPVDAMAAAAERNMALV